MFKRIQILGVKLDRVTYAQALERVEILMHSKGYYGVTPNPEMLLNANRDSKFKAILNGAALCVADGIGLLWAAYFLKKTQGKNRFKKLFWLPVSLAMIIVIPARIRSVLPQRVTGSDLLFKLVEHSQEQRWTFFLLGAAPGVAEKAAHRLLKKYPRAQCAGSYAGEPGRAHWPEIKKRLLAAQPDLLFVAYGSPAQEKWIVEHLKELPSVRFAMGIGGAFDFAAGQIRRAPKAFQFLGLEWLWRLARQPRRLPRIVNATWHFVRTVYQQG